MPRKKFLKIKSSYATLLLVLILGAVSVFSFYYFFMQTAETGFNESTATTYDISIVDAFDSSNTDDLADIVTIAWYEFDYSEVDSADLEDTLADLEWADLTLEDADDEQLVPEEDFLYICKISDTDCLPIYLSTDSRVFENKLPLLSLGENIVKICNETEDTALVCYAQEGGVTINQTNFRNWVLHAQTLDASEDTGEATNKEGYIPYYDPENLQEMNIVVKIEFNTTASTSFASLKSLYDNEETASGVYLYIEVDVILNDELILDVQFSSALGTDYEVIGMSLGYGNADSVTLWDSQN